MGSGLLVGCSRRGGGRPPWCAGKGYTACAVSVLEVGAGGVVLGDICERRRSRGKVVGGGAVGGR